MKIYDFFNFSCLNCKNLPFFGIKYKKNKVFLESLCKNNHYQIGNFIKEYEKLKENSFKIKIKNNENNKNNEIFNENLIVGFCKTCNKNIYENYSEKHKKHKILFLENILINNNEIEYLKNKINKSKKFMLEIEKNYLQILLKIKKYLLNFSNCFEKFKILNDFQINFCNNLIFNYENRNSNENLYELFFNIKNIKFNNFENNLNFDNLNIEISIKNFINFIKNKNNFILKNSSLNLKLISNKKNNKISNKNNKISNIFLPCLQILKNNKIFNFSSKKIHKFNFFNDFYIGKIINGKLNGFFKSKISNLIFFAFYKNNLILNPIKFYIKKSLKKNKIKKFSGYFSNNKKNGFGIYKTKNSKFIGEFFNDKFNGIGIEFYSNGERFEGEFKNGKKNGIGIFYTKNKNLIYLCKYKNNILINQILQEKKKDFLIYYEIKNSKFNYSIKFIKNNIKIENLYLNNEKYFEIFYKNNMKIYECFIKDNKKNDKGKIYFNNKLLYEGYFLNNQKHGIGKYYLQNGDKLIGNWKEGKLNGIVLKFIKEKNIWIKLEYKNGILIEN